MNFPGFLQRWINPPAQKIDFDHVFKYQCVDLILEGLYEIDGINGAYGNAIDFWNRTDAKILVKYNRILSTDIQPGDIVILKTAGFYGPPENDPGEGHIGWATGNQNDQQLEILEQNGQTGSGDGAGGNAIRTRLVPKNRIAGLLRHKPVAVAPVVPMITIDQLNQLYQSLLNRLPDAGGVAHYVGHYTYDFVSNDIQNSAEYHMIHDPRPAAPAPPPPPPVPVYAPPLPPAPIKLATKVTVVTTVPAYAEFTDALHGQNQISTLAPGSYYQFATQNSMLDLSTDNQKHGVWINPRDNVEPPVVPEPPMKPVADVIDATHDWQKTYHAFPKPVKYKALSDMKILDIAALDPVGLNIESGEPVPMLGTFVRNNIVYLLCRLDSDVKKEYFYGVPTDDFNIGSPSMVSELYGNSQQQLKDNRDYRRAQGHMTMDDKIYYFQQTVARAVNDGVRFIDGIIPIKKLGAYFKGKNKT